MKNEWESRKKKKEEKWESLLAKFAFQFKNMKKKEKIEGGLFYLLFSETIINDFTILQKEESDDDDDEELRRYSFLFQTMMDEIMLNIPSSILFSRWLMVFELKTSREDIYWNFQTKRRKENARKVANNFQYYCNLNAIHANQSCFTTKSIVFLYRHI